MKRSEMVQILTRSFIEHTNSQDGIDEIEMFSRVLRDIEKAGMRPPMKKDPVLFRETYEWDRE